jgi:hypothetical protein
MTNDDDENARLRVRIRDLELALGQRDKTLAVTFRLTPALNNLLGLLISVPVVTPEMIRDRLEIANDAKVGIHRLRKQLEPWDIKIQQKRNLGYWLEDEDKARIRGLVAAKVGPPKEETLTVVTGGAATA